MTYSSASGVPVFYRTNDVSVSFEFPLAIAVVSCWALTLTTLSVPERPRQRSQRKDEKGAYRDADQRVSVKFGNLFQRL